MDPRTDLLENSAIRAAVEKMDTQLNKRAGYNSNDIRGNLEKLARFGSVEIGWRESCGTTDRTHFIAREWWKLVKLLAKHGATLKEERQKHGNAYATSKGGFWNSIVYTLPA